MPALWPKASVLTHVRALTVYCYSVPQQPPPLSEDKNPFPLPSLEADKNRTGTKWMADFSAYLVQISACLWLLNRRLFLLSLFLAH